MGGALSFRKDFAREGLERWTEVHRLTDCIADGVIPREFGNRLSVFFRNYEPFYKSAFERIQKNDAVDDVRAVPKSGL